MKWMLVLVVGLLLFPAVSALQDELQVLTCSGTGCSVAELNTYNNVSGMTVPRSGGAAEDTDMTSFTGGADSTITGVSAYLSHGGETGISGTMTVDFRNATDQTVWCSATTAHSASFTQVTLTPTGCGWTIARLENLNIQYQNGDGGSQQDAFIDFVNVTVNFTLPPVQNSFERYTFVNHSVADIAWRSSLAANSTVEYGTTTALGTTVSDASLVTNHTLRLTGLSRDQRYFYNVTSCDAFTCDTTGPFSFVAAWTLNVTSCTGATCDAAEAQLYNNVTAATFGSATPYAANFTALPVTNATITNLTYRSYSNASADIIFRNRTSKEQWCTQSVVATGMTYHEITPSGCGWTQERADSLEVVHNTTAGLAILDFSAVLTQWVIAPQINNVRTQDITTDSATVLWDTRNDANSTLNWGPTTALGNIETNNTFVWSRNFSLTSLADNTTYFYNVTSCTEETCETQGPFSFETLELIAPNILDLRVSTRNENNVTIRWETDKPANSSIRWGATPSLGSQQDNATLSTSHAFTLTGLLAGTLYHYEVESCDAIGCNTITGLRFITAPSADHCTYRYTEQSDGWVDGMLQDGDVLVLECRLPARVGESEELKITALFERITDSLLLTTPRLLVDGTEVLYP